MEHQVPTTLRGELRGMLIHPNQTMVTLAPNLGKGALIVAGLIVTVGIKTALEIAYTAVGNTIGFAIGGVVIGIGMAWVSLTLLLRLIAHALGGAGNYRNLLALMGYAAIPMILTTLVSIVIYIISPVLLPNLGGAKWGTLHTLIGWIGMAWGWPGLLSYYALHHNEQLSAGRAGGIVIVVYILALFGWFLTMLVPGLFG